MLQWLSANLDSTDRRWIIVFFHHPPYTKGSHESDNPSDSGGRLFDMRQIVLPVLEVQGVNLVLIGHSHSYERFYLLHGHYGTSDTLQPELIVDGGDGSPAGDGPYTEGVGPGSVYVVAGSSGQVGGGFLDHPVMAVSLAELGSMVLDVAGDRMDAVFLDAAGQRRDVFTIQLPLYADVFESGDTSAWGAVVGN